MATENDPDPIIPPIPFQPAVSPVPAAHCRLLVLLAFLIALYLYSHLEMCFLTFNHFMALPRLLV